MFVAIMAVCSFITIPLGFTPVPVNLGTLGVFLAGGLLGRKYGTISLGVYVLLGAVGVPIFAGFKGGISVLVGPTGGYIIGYILAAFIVGSIVDRFLDYEDPLAKQYLVLVLAMVSGLLLCYALGTIWFIISTGTGVLPSLIACVFPFLPGDALKIAAATILVNRLRMYLNLVGR